MLLHPRLQLRANRRIGDISVLGIESLERLTGLLNARDSEKVGTCHVASIAQERRLLQQLASAL
jgi:hypothetical protein